MLNACVTHLRVTLRVASKQQIKNASRTRVANPCKYWVFDSHFATPLRGTLRVESKKKNTVKKVRVAPESQPLENTGFLIVTLRLFCESLCESQAKKR